MILLPFDRGRMLLCRAVRAAGAPALFSWTELDQEPLADHEVAFEAAAHLGVVDRGRAFEQTALGDVDIAAIGQIRLDAALDNQLVS